MATRSSGGVAWAYQRGVGEEERHLSTWRADGRNPAWRVGGNGVKRRQGKRRKRMALSLACLPLATSSVCRIVGVSSIAYAPEACALWCVSERGRAGGVIGAICSITAWPAIWRMP